MEPERAASGWRRGRPFHFGKPAKPLGKVYRERPTVASSSTFVAFRLERGVIRAFVAIGGSFWIATLVSDRMLLDTQESPAMKTIAIYNNKGGVGKTTIAAHLVYQAEARGIRTIAVAMDRQGDLPKWLSNGDHARQEGTMFEYGQHVTVVYSPDEPPRGLRGADLVVVDTPASIDIAASVNPDVWIAPCDGRMALEDLGNVAGTMLSCGAEVILVFNRADIGGVRTVAAMRRASEQVPGLMVWPDIIPDSGPVKRAGEYYLPAWEVPYGAQTRGAKAIRAFTDGVLDRYGLRASKASAKRAARRA